jgi:hypothetical protein
MKRRLLSVVVVLLMSSAASAQHVGAFHRCFGGSSYDFFTTMIKTSDGGSLSLGITRSNDGDVGGFYHGGVDLYAVKRKKKHTLQWKTVLGGEGDEFASNIVELEDGSFMVAGMTQSTSGDITNPLWNLDQVKKHTTDSDIWLFHLSPAGTIVWSRTIGGSGSDVASSIVKVNGGMLIAGTTSSNDGIFASSKQIPGHAFAAMLDDSGRVKWVKRYGGSVSDVIYSATQISNGNFVLAGMTDSQNGDVTDNHGDYDHWLLCIDDTGRLISQHCIGGDRWDQANKVIATQDGGFLSIGWLEKGENDRDVLLVKGDADGTPLWQKTYGGSDIEEGWSIIETTDHGFVFAADVNTTESAFNFWISKVDASGTMNWQTTAGGSEDDVPFGVIQESDTVFLVAGYTNSDDGDIAGGNHGVYDAWITEIDLGGEQAVLASADVESPAMLVYSSGDHIVVRYTLNETKPVSIDLIDIMGRVRSVRSESFESPGEHRDILDASNLVSGTYFVRVTEDGKSITKPIIVSR